MKQVISLLSIFILISCSEQSSKTAFRWDFSKKKKFVYTMEQSSKAETKTAHNLAGEKSVIQGTGNLNVQIKDNNQSDLSISNNAVSIFIYDQYDNIIDTIHQEIPEATVANMQPNGSFTDPKTDIFFKLFFPLPKANLKNGESDTIPMQIPFNLEDAELYTTGQNIFTFNGYKDIENRTCAVLDSKLNISKLVTPKEMKGEYKYTVLGNSTYFFDLENGHYVGGDIKANAEILIDPKEDDSFENRTSLKIENTYKIRLKRIEE